MKESTKLLNKEIMKRDLRLIASIYKREKVIRRRVAGP
jgi:hypothetical protein